MPRLAFALTISVLLHAVLLYHGLSVTTHAPDNASLPLTLRLNAMAQTTPVGRDSIEPPAPQWQDKINASPKLPAAATGSHTREAVDNSHHLDIGWLFEQARDYAAREMRNAGPAPRLAGEYFGTYDGTDTGTFTVQLDGNGRVSGSGQSRSYGIGFVIAGGVDANGLIQMAGKGDAGDARFSGNLNLKTGKISGSWRARGSTQGTFSGHREN